VDRREYRTDKIGQGRWNLAAGQSAEPPRCESIASAHTLDQTDRSHYSRGDKPRADWHLALEASPCIARSARFHRADPPEVLKP